MTGLGMSLRNNTSLLLLLDGILSQDEQSTSAAIAQIEKLDPSPQFDSIRESPLRSASSLEVMVRRLLVVQPQLAKIPSASDGSLPLHFAASIGNVQVASLLLSHYREAALKHNTKGKIPLHYAAREGRTEVVSFLLKFVPDCAAVLTKKGKLALHFAAGEGHVDIVRDLLKVHPAGAKLPSKKGKIAMHFAARWGHIEVANDLYQIHEDSVRTLDYDGMNPLHDATREGQLEMCKFLVERCPQAMYKSNIRGEIPLYAAIRSRNVHLCAFLIRAWPGSGKQVLQSTNDFNDVSDWEPVILDLCLRGAVDNFSGAYTSEENYIDDHGLRIVGRICNCKSRKNNAFPNNNAIMGMVTPNDQDFRYMHRQRNQKNGGILDEHSIGMSRIVSDTSFELNSMCIPRPKDDVGSPKRLLSDLNISLPRSKSPILDTEEGTRKRSLSGCVTGKKRQRRGSADFDKDEKRCVSQDTLETRSFYQLHAALESSSSTTVLEFILTRYPEQQSQIDDFGRLPLHIAVSHYRSKGYVDLVLEKIWKVNPQASFVRDCFGQLPLHLALMTRADARLVQVLLESNPCSGTERCQIVDERFTHKLPIHLAMMNGCDLSTVFMLVRCDPAMVQKWKFG